MNNIECAICSKSLDGAKKEDYSKLYAKGCDSINQIIPFHEKKIPEVHPGQFVHKLCRNEFICGKRNIAETTKQDSPELQDLSATCFFCDQPAKFTDKGKKDVQMVKKLDFIENVHRSISKRNDEWSKKVQDRIEEKDLLNATYHKSCSINFQNLKNVPLCHGGVAKKAGRPQNTSRNEAFIKLTEHMEGDTERVFSIKELTELMQIECEEHDQLENRYLKKKLLEHFGDNIMVISSDGKPDLVIFSQSLKILITKIYEDQLERDGQNERQFYISKAAKIIKSDVLIMPTDKTIYPTSDMLSDLDKQKNFVPESLQHFLSKMFVEANCDLKIASIGQSIIQAVRPRSLIAPLQIGLGVQLHHSFRSKFLIETLFKMGFSSSYPEVQKFKFCAASSIDEIHPNPNQVVKFMADNVDHDTRTIDGKGTFHGMGMIAAFTPANQVVRCITRSKATIADVRAIGQIEILPYTNELVGNGLSYKELSDFQYDDDCLHTDLLLKTTWALRTTRPSWSGTMQLISDESHPGNSSIQILPMIDLNASDSSCIYSTLHFLCTAAEKHGVTPIITFDQPLYWKASLIIQDEPTSSRLKKIVLILGGFHLQMSFLGSIGHLMTGTGLQECLETVYASNSVIYMLTGKSIQRAVRGHFLVDTALNALLTKKAETILPEFDWNTSLAECAILYDQLISLEITSTDLHCNGLLQSLMQYFATTKTKLQGQRTGRLWIQYMDMIDLLRDFLRSERTGSWKLHLATVRKMIPYFAAAGHNNYAKSAQIYLQQMEQLEHNHPDVYKQFMDGHHVVRRSDRYWAGLSCDLTIEQSLMRAAKSRGGLTRGGGCSEDQRIVWIQSMPACAEINIAMQKITNLYFETSDQHKDCSDSRQARDEKDTKTIYEFLEDRDPFLLDDVALRSIYTGEEAQANVNVDTAVTIGNKIISKMVGRNVSEYSFETVNKAVTMGSSNTILIDGKVTHIDPQLLFQRLMFMSRNFNDEKLKNVFTFELSQMPSSLFDDAGLMREAKINEFVSQYIVGKETRISSDYENSCRHVLCGNSFLNRIQWKKNQTFGDICSLYLDYAKKFNNPTIVFDSVPDGTTKDEFNFRRSKGIRGVNIKFSSHTVFNSKKDHFLANKLNKERFVAMLADVLIANGCTVVKAKTDQNLMIATTAIELAMEDPVIVAADDWEIIIMLCYCYKDDGYGYDIIFKSHECLKKPPVFHSIQSIRGKHGQDVIDKIYFLHAIGGCKTTSHIHTIGKGQPFKKFLSSSEFRLIADKFIDKNSTTTQIVEAGLKALIMLYDGKPDESLDSLRFKQFSKKVATKTSAVLVNSLSPTSSAATYHVLRVYFQVQQWLGNCTLNPEKFGWKKNSQNCNRLIPMTTDMNPAPPELLSKIRCQCKGNCSNLKCSCFKNQLKCTSACGVCCGTDCLNIYVPDDNETNDE